MEKNTQCVFFLYNIKNWGATPSFETMILSPVDEPYTSDYTVKKIVSNEAISVEFCLGFRVSPRTNLMFKKVIGQMIQNQEITINSKYQRMQNTSPVGDLQFIVMEKFLSNDNELPFFERIIMKFYFWIKDVSLSEEKGFGLDQSNVETEKFPLLINPVSSINLRRLKNLYSAKAIKKRKTQLNWIIINYIETVHFAFSLIPATFYPDKPNTT